MNSQFHKLTPLRIFVIATIIAAATSISPVSAQEPPRQPPPPNDFAPGQILVKFKPAVGQLSAQRALAAQNLTVVDTIPSIDVLKVSVEPGQELERIAALRSDPNVLYAEPDYIAHAVVVICSVCAYNGDRKPPPGRSLLHPGWLARKLR